MNSLEYLPAYNDMIAALDAFMLLLILLLGVRDGLMVINKNNN